MTEIDEMAARVLAIFEQCAQILRARGEYAKASSNPLPSGQVVLALEVVRQVGDWQRSIVLTLDPNAPHRLDFRLLDADYDAILEIGGSAENVAPEHGLSLMRVGIRALLDVLEGPAASEPDDPYERAWRELVEREDEQSDDS